MTTNYLIAKCHKALSCVQEPSRASLVDAWLEIAHGWGQESHPVPDALKTEHSAIDADFRSTTSLGAALGNQHDGIFLNSVNLLPEDEFHQLVARVKAFASRVIDWGEKQPETEAGQGG